MQQLRRGYLCDLSVAECRESRFEQPAILAESRFRATLAPLLARELFGDFPEGVAPRGLGNFLQPPFEAGILTARQKLARGLAAIACVRKRYFRIRAEGDLLLLTTKAVGEAPEPAAVGANQQIQPVEVREFVVALGRPGVANTRVVEHGVLCWHRGQNTNAVPAAANGSERTCTL